MAHAGSFQAGGNGNKGLQCTAKSKRSQQRCKGTAVIGSPSQKCRMHGGKGNRIGPANPSFKSGRHSKYLPSRLDALYREALSNPQLTEMSDHIALLEARIQMVLEQTASGDPAPKWHDIREVFADIETGLLSGDQAKSIASMEVMHKLLDSGERWDSAWKTITDTLDALRKLTDTEIKRKKELNQMIPVERVIVLMAAVATAVKRNVTDPEQIRAVQRELEFLHFSNRVPGDKNMKRVGPEVIDIAAR